MNPFRVLRKIVVSLLAIVGAFVIVLVVAGLWLGSFGPKPKPVPAKDVVLTLELGAPIHDRSGGGPLPFGAFSHGATLRDLVAGLEAAAGDSRVKGLVAHVGSGPLNMAYAQELRDAVKAFRDKGKFAVAFAETFGEAGDGNTHYYLATAFEEIWLQPSGDVNLVGFSMEQPFMVDTLNFLGVTAQIDQRMEYKGLADPFTKSSMPPPIRENLQRLVNSWLGQVAQGMAERGKFDADAARSLIHRGPFLASQAQADKLIDKIGYWNDLTKAVDDRAGKDASWFSLEDYAANIATPGDDAARIAVVYGLGAVQLSTGKGDSLFGPAAMESSEVATAIRDAVDDPDIKAIIFRVDSPGGSYVASDTIWSEVQRARDLGKPVIVSMGALAASGGYFVSAPAAKIVAQPGTITGSIGVAGGKVVFAGLWNTLRLHWDGVKAGANADLESPHRLFSNEGWARMEEGLDRVYADFTQKVAAGRNLPIEKVQQVAKGQVWTGSDAKDRGLVDALGGYSVAIQLARDAAKIPPDQQVRVEEFPAPENPLEKLFEQAISSGQMRHVEAQRLETLLRLADWLEPVAAVIAPFEGSAVTAPQLVSPVQAIGN
ncbi:MAG TPA: signal peptide peptidase SppA [Verrucomicrobiae bacterium]|nr:signal peptide peptidase SppA [Verrucomicrobiae bacterium]